jgi:hypothetical protein
MNKKIVLTLIVLFLIGSLIFIQSNTLLLTGQIIRVSDTRSFTTAICNKTNYCEDHEILCEGNISKEITPTGFAVQMSEKWKDPRGEQDLKNICN